jgi:hypothetical protein
MGSRAVQPPETDATKDLIKLYNIAVKGPFFIGYSNQAGVKGVVVRDTRTNKDALPFGRARQGGKIKAFEWVNQQLRDMSLTEIEELEAEAMKRTAQDDPPYGLVGR